MLRLRAYPLDTCFVTEQWGGTLIVNGQAAGQLTLGNVIMTGTAVLTANRPVIIGGGQLSGTLSGAGPVNVTGTAVTPLTFQNAITVAQNLAVPVGVVATFTGGGALRGALDGAGSVTLGAVTLGGATATSFGSLSVTSNGNTAIDTSLQALTISAYTLSGSASVTASGAQPLTFGSLTLSATNTLTVSTPVVSVTGGTVAGALRNNLANARLTLTGVTLAGTAALTHTVATTLVLGQGTSVLTGTFTAPSVTDIGNLCVWSLFCRLVL